MSDPNSWQPLALARIVAQNGIPQPGSVQSFIGPHWGHVRGFALPASDAGVPIDPGLRRSSMLQRPVRGTSGTPSPSSAAAPTSIPEAACRSTSGPAHRAATRSERTTVAGTTSIPRPEAVPPNVVLRGDYARALAEYWADGPRSETPPGHWNSVANEVSDSPGLARRIGGRGPSSIGSSGTSSSTSR